MILTEVMKIKVALNELQKCIPTSMEAFTPSKYFQCKEMLPINSVDELIAYDSNIQKETNFKTDFVRHLVGCLQ